MLDLRRLLRPLLLAGAAMLTAASACGGVTDTRVSARESATKATCDRFQACNLIGPGQNYPDYSSCEIAWRANWDQYWPVAECQGHVDQANLQVCVDRISSTQCTRVLDLLATIGICGKVNVCSGGVPTDGGGQ